MNSGVIPPGGPLVLPPGGPLLPLGGALLGGGGLPPLGGPLGAGAAEGPGAAAGRCEGPVVTPGGGPDCAVLATCVGGVLEPPPPQPMNGARRKTRAKVRRMADRPSWVDKTSVGGNPS